MEIREISITLRNIITVLQRENNTDMNNDDTISQEHVKDNIIDKKDGHQNHLHIPVYYYTSPTMGV